MDKQQKQVEEIAKEKISKQWQRRDEYCLRIQKATKYKGDCDHEDVPSILVDYEKEIKKELIPEDAVVLTREEYDGKEIVVEMSGGHKLRLTVGKFGEMSKILEEYTRKETAEKLLDKVDNESNGQTKAITDLLRKEYGVEVK